MGERQTDRQTDRQKLLHWLLLCRLDPFLTRDPTYKPWHIETMLQPTDLPGQDTGYLSLSFFTLSNISCSWLLRSFFPWLLKHRPLLFCFTGLQCLFLALPCVSSLNSAVSMSFVLDFPVYSIRCLPHLILTMTLPNQTSCNPMWIQFIVWWILQLYCSPDLSSSSNCLTCPVGFLKDIWSLNDYDRTLTDTGIS